MGRKLVARTMSQISSDAHGRILPHQIELTLPDQIKYFISIRGPRATIADHSVTLAFQIVSTAII